MLILTISNINKEVMKRVNIDKRDIAIIDRLQKGTTLHKRCALILQTLLLNYKFKSFVFEMRESLKIPRSGITDFKNLKKFISPGYILRDLVTKETIHLDEKTIKKIESFLDDECLRTTFPDLGWFDNVTMSIISEYILINNITLIGYYTGSLMITDYSDNDSQNEIEFRFPPTASVEDMIEFIKKNREEINILKEKIIGKKINNRLKLTKNLERDLAIYNRYNVLLSTPKEKRESKYIELQISTELAKEGIIISDGTIKSVINNMRKLINKSNNK